MINVVVEGDSDREMAKAVARAAGHDVQRISVARGKTKLDPLIPKYNRAAQQFPWVVFRDADRECPVTLAARLTKSIHTLHPKFQLRIARSMSEAWFLADAKSFSEYFHVSLALITMDPESLVNAKKELLRLCGRSHSRVIRSEVTTSNGRIGPLYGYHINEFAMSHWRPEIAAERSDSLRRAILRIGEIPAYQ